MTTMTTMTTIASFVLLVVMAMARHGDGKPAEFSLKSLPPPTPTLATFNPRGPSNVTGVIGDTAELPCAVDNLGSYMVLWARGPDRTVIAIDDRILTADTRYRSRWGAGEHTWYLDIDDSTAEDAGEYTCSLSTPGPPMQKVFNLRMIENRDDRRWRTDSRCGYPHYLHGALSDVQAECDSEGAYPCCSSGGYCGFTSLHCDCPDCIDYRTEDREVESTTVTPAAEGCPPPYEPLSWKCVLYSSEHLPWQEAQDYCTRRGGHLITFASLDQLMEVVDIITLKVIDQMEERSSRQPFWVGLSTRGRRAPGGGGLKWRWVVGDQEADEPTAAQFGAPVEGGCGYLLPGAASTLRHNGDCSALKLPLCQL